MKLIVPPAALALLLALACGRSPAPADAPSQSPSAPKAAPKAKWLTNLEEALAQAKKDDKLVFADFTGSDWCRPCVAFHKKVLTQPTFLKYAQANLILVEIDYPISKPQPAELKKANKALKEKYKIESWPTILVLDAEGKILCRENGYEGDPAPQYTANLKKKLSR
tara:strand:- start:642 stop:1139 length:498 start_codon:yes stop_codon:yes gene_type:complete